MSRWILGAAVTALVAALGVETLLWLDANQLPDGYQNEYLHVGNAMDLWGAVVDRDWWHVNYYGAANYWPPGFYIAPWPLFAVFGASHHAMVLTNLLHLALLLWATFRLGEAIGGARVGWMAMALVPLYPSVFGNLVRFEPNVALIAWVTFAALCLVRSEGLVRLKWSTAYGLACCVGLMMDRLSFGFFLLWPTLWCLRRRGAWKGFLLAAGLVLLLTGWWHWNFAQLHLQEVLSQQAVGEIDSAGTLSESAKAPLLYYPLILLDSQAGPVLGLTGLAALLMGRRQSAIPLVIVLGSMGVFTLIAKKQAYYTLPMLGCLAVLTADALRGRAGAMAFAALMLFGVEQHYSGLWKNARTLLPEAWVMPRHPQALPPRGAELPIDEVAEAAADVGQTVVFSDDYSWFEGFVVLNLRQRLWPRQVRGLIGDPTGTYEWMDDADTFVYVSLQGDETWPSRSRMETALEQHHYTLSELPPAIEAIEEDRKNWRLVETWELKEGGTVTVWGRH